MSKINFFSFVFLFFASALVVGLGQPAWYSWLAPFAGCLGYAFFWKSLDWTRTKAGLFSTAFLWYFSVQLIQLSWMASIEYQGFYILFVLGGICGVQSLFFGFFSLWTVNNNRTAVKLFAAASLWTLWEWGRLYFLCGFSWNPAGMALAGTVASMQIGSLFGVLGLTFTVILTNLVVYRALTTRFNLAQLITCLVVIAIPYLYGSWKLSFPPSNEKNVAVALVQTGLLPDQKNPLHGRLDRFISPYFQWQRIIHILEQRELKSLDLIVLPESTVPFVADKPIYLLSAVEKVIIEECGEEGLKNLPPIQAPFVERKWVNGKEVWLTSNLFWGQFLANRYRADVIVGLDTQDQESQKNYNAAVHFKPDRVKVENHYAKRILVPLAEYLPFTWMRPLVARYGINDFFTHGKVPGIFEGCLRISPSICYEETFGHLMRGGRLAGGELFVNLTNDNWYPRTRLPKQHCEHGRIRAVENGIPLLRACNTGVTTVIDAYGRTLATFSEGDETAFGALEIQFGVSPIKTFYTRWGDGAIIGLCFIFLAVFSFIKLRCQR